MGGGPIPPIQNLEWTALRESDEFPLPQGISSPFPKEGEESLPSQGQILPSHFGKELPGLKGKKEIEKKIEK